MEGSHAALSEWAQDLLLGARAMVEAGYREGDAIKVRKGAERAWKAACAAVDAAMAARGIPRDGTAADRARHYAYLDGGDGLALAMAYSFIADRLHRLCAEQGHLPSQGAMARYLDGVDAFIRDVAGAR